MAGPDGQELKGETESKARPRVQSGTNAHDIEIVKLQIAAAEKAATNEFDVKVQEAKDRMAERLEQMRQDLQRAQLESHERVSRFNKLFDTIKWLGFGAMALAAIIVSSIYEADVKKTEIELGRR